MTLDDFKRIFYMEYAHRIWGRMVGLVFVVPLAAFWAKGWIRPQYRPVLLGLGSLIGFQGVLGYLMVKSGLDVRAVFPRTASLLACLPPNPCPASQEETPGTPARWPSHIFSHPPLPQNDPQGAHVPRVRYAGDVGCPGCMGPDWRRRRQCANCALLCYSSSSNT